MHTQVGMQLSIHTSDDPIGNFYVSDPRRIRQLYFPPGLEVPSDSNRAGSVVHGISVDSLAGRK